MDLNNDGVEMLLNKEDLKCSESTTIYEGIRCIKKDKLKEWEFCQTLNDFKLWHIKNTPWFSDVINSILANEEYNNYLKKKI